MDRAQPPTGAHERVAWGMAITASLVAIGSAAYAATGGTTPSAVTVGTTFVAAMFIATGTIAWLRRPANRTGQIMMATGVSLAIGLVQGPPAAWLSPIGVLGGTLSGVLLVYLILAFPTGRLVSRRDRAFVGVAAVLLAATNIGRLLAFDPASEGLPFTNPYQLTDDPALRAITLAADRAISVTILLWFLVIVINRWTTASAAGRHVLGPVLLPATALTFTVIASIVADASAVASDAQAVLLTLQILARAAVPVGFLVGLLRTRMARGGVADLIVELGSARTPDRRREALAHALGDPTLSLAVWSPGVETFVDESGRAFASTSADPGRAVTVVERDGSPLVAIIHDAALLEDPALLASVASALRLVVENERLQSEVEAQLREVRESKARMVAAGDAERRRVERDLHDGAQQRLVSLSLALRLARTRLESGSDAEIAGTLDDAADQARAALAELRELARGIYPQILTSAGLVAAVESLAQRASVVVTVESHTEGRFPAAVEGAAYFVVSEALANVAKYARASRARVMTDWADGHLQVEIEDDGVGGADRDGGSGLRGLDDRLGAIGGSLRILSPTGGGTRLIATIPTPQPALGDAGSHGSP